MSGDGVVAHNRRTYFAENVDQTRTHLNVEYCYTPIEEAYHQLFDAALAEFNAKQKRKDRCIENYYEKIRAGKQEKPFYEVIFQVGNKSLYMALYPNLQVKAFLHNTIGSTFHPKFCWFDCGEFGYVITGSGNLTQKGMQRNREAFEAKTVTPDELTSIVQYWNSWLESVNSFLFPLSDEAVVQRAEENIHRMQVVRPRRTVAAARPHTEITSEEQVIQEFTPTNGENTEPVLYVDDELGSWEYDTTSAVLICEIPRGERRWNQANFDANTFKTYFESTPGVTGQMALILRDVKRDGSMGEIRHRPPVSVASHNYRIELYVDRGTAYPANGRVLGIFVKLSSRTFLYSLVFPTNSEYTVLQAKLDSERQRRDRLVRYQTCAEELKSLAPSLPILQYLSQAD